MTRAEVDAVRPDLVAAVTYVKQARQQLASARIEGVDPESSLGLAYQAAIKALTGALIAVGRRVTGGEAGRLVLIRGGAESHERSRGAVRPLDRMRRTTQQVFYEISEVSALELQQAHRDVGELIDLAARYVLDHGGA